MAHSATSFSRRMLEAAPGCRGLGLSVVFSSLREVSGHGVPRSTLTAC